MREYNPQDENLYPFKKLFDFYEIIKMMKYSFSFFNIRRKFIWVTSALKNVLSEYFHFSLIKIKMSRLSGLYS